MTREKAIRIATKWSEGHVCTLREGEAREYHNLCLEALREQPRWISVEERLPEKDVLVLCIGKRGGMFLGYPDYCCDGGRAYVYVPNDKGCRYATHWMYLPEAPEVEV